MDKKFLESGMLPMFEATSEAKRPPLQQGIPTRYGGTQFRSRLEARWAAFFDLVEWKWEYEPFDLNGWIPDFALIGRNHTTIVEVKPIAKIEDPVAQRAIAKAEQAMQDADRQEELLLLGYVWPQGERSDVALGWLCERDTGWRSGWATAEFVARKGWGFCHGLGDYTCRITNEHEKYWLTACDEIPTDLWREAGNRTQWHKR